MALIIIYIKLKKTIKPFLKKTKNRTKKTLVLALSFMACQKVISNTAKRTLELDCIQVN